MKSNKYWSLIAIVGATIGLTACSDSFFDLDNPNNVSASTYWKTESDALMALTACYDAMQSQNLYDDNIDGWKFGFLARETSTDNGDHTWGDWMLGSSIARGTSSANDECFSMYWNANYEFIKRCNVLIANIDLIPESALSNERKESYKAEAIALRALGYCNLVSVFRDVPYLDRPLTLTEAEAPKSTKAEIASKVIADLEVNVPKLPSVGSNAVGRMSREAGYSIMGRLALFTQNYDKAISAYKNVIGKVSLFKSGDGSDFAANFADLFTIANENHPEVLLSVHYNGPGLGEGSCFGVCWSMPMNAIEASRNLCDDFYCIDGLPIDKSPLFNGRLAPNDTKSSLDNIDYARYENRDPRLKGTLFVPGEEWNGTVWPNGWFPATSYACIRKWYTPWDTANEYDGSLDYYVIRYSEVLLSLAEALVEKGGYNESEVAGYVNEVRQRVGMPKIEDVEGTGLTQDAMRQIIRHERRVELAFEDLRMADLYRWGEWEANINRIQADRAKGYGVYNRSFRGKQDTVWPIPQGEIDTNSQLVQHDEWK